MKGIVKVPLADVYLDNMEVSEVVTQVTFSTGIEILEKKGSYYKIQVPVQGGYRGWIRKESVILRIAPKPYWKKAIVQKQGAGLKNIPAESGIKRMALAVNTRLYITARQQDWYAVWLPGGERAWVKAADVSWEKEGAAGDKIEGRHLLEAARSFLGVPYRWGGITPAGFDCSGFVYTVYALHQFYLHRDADLQYRYDGFPVKFAGLCSGDLLYFYGENKTKPAHVGIYENAYCFIHASSKQKRVVRANLLEDNWREKIAGIKRILPGAAT